MSFARLLIGCATLGAALATAPAVVVFTLFNFSRHPLPVDAQLFALAAAAVSVPLAWLCLAPLVKRIPRITIHIV